MSPNRRYKSRLVTGNCSLVVALGKGPLRAAPSVGRMVAEVQHEQRGTASTDDKQRDTAGQGAPHHRR